MADVPTFAWVRATSTDTQSTKFENHGAPKVQFRELLLWGAITYTMLVVSSLIFIRQVVRNNVQSVLEVMYLNDRHEKDQ